LWFFRHTFAKRVFLSGNPTDAVSAHCCDTGLLAIEKIPHEWEWASCAQRRKMYYE